MSCPNCRCYECRSYYRNPAPWGASAWASHMDAPPVANEGPATSLETSMTEHFLGPMRRNPSWDPLERKIKKLCLYSELSAAEISEYMNIPFSWAAEACRTYREDYGSQMSEIRRRVRFPN